MSRITVSVQRSIAGPVLICFGNKLNGFNCAMNDLEAMNFCDAIRRVVESPTQAVPRGENVVTMSLGKPESHP